MNITELVAERLMELLNEQGGAIQIQRNDFAQEFGCVPSQINYVITSRFTKEQGYIVESRRGGGGFIKIVRLDRSRSELILHIINSIGDMLNEQTTRILVKSLCLNGELDPIDGKLILAACADENFKGLSESGKQEIRANIVKAMLINTVNTDR